MEYSDSYIELKYYINAVIFTLYLYLFFTICPLLGSNYWVFDAEHKIKGPDPLQTIGLPVTHIQAALRLKEQHVHHTYFFKSGNYWRLDSQENRVDPAFPRSIQRDWRGIPDEIDAAFQDAHGTSSSAFLIHISKC